jgi:CBS domain-containing protein
MKVGEAMTRGVISIAPESLMTKAAHMMLKYDVSGLPVINAKGELVGIITEGDFLRRAELGIEHNRGGWIRYVTDIGPLAAEYARSHGRKVSQVMTKHVVTVTEDTSLEEVVRLMEDHRIKRVPVLRGEKLVGIVSRGNLLHAFIVLSPKASTAPVSDAAIKTQIEAELQEQVWTARVNVEVIVNEGTVELRGVIFDERQRIALSIAVENFPGVTRVEDHLIFRADTLSQPGYAEAHRSNSSGGSAAADGLPNNGR